MCICICVNLYLSVFVSICDEDDAKKRLTREGSEGRGRVTVGWHLIDCFVKLCICYCMCLYLCVFVSICHLIDCFVNVTSSLVFACICICVYSYLCVFVATWLTALSMLPACWQDLFLFKFVKHQQYLFPFKFIIYSTSICIWYLIGPWKNQLISASLVTEVTEIWKTWFRKSTSVSKFLH